MREMKDSGIEGAGICPSTWGVSRLGYECYIRARLGWKGLKANEYVNEGYAFLSALNIQNGRMCWMPLNYITQERYDESPEIKLQIGDVLLVKDGAGVGKCARIDMLPCGGAAPNSSIAVVTALSNLDYRYVCYYLQSSVFLNFVFKLYNGMGVPHLTQEVMGKISILVPSMQEQQAICNYLDAKCAEINLLIFDIQAQIDTLEQYKRSIIIEAVTKGLNPAAELRDSGIVFVGDIPAHWTLHPLYYYFDERKNKNIFGQETNLLSLSYGRIIRKDINSNNGLLPESFNTYNIIEAGDIIIRPTDLQNDKRSLRTGLSKEHGIITSAYIALKPIKPVNTAYFQYLLHAFDVMKVFYNMGNGVRQGLNFSEFSRLMVFNPPLEEQDSIASYLDAKCGKIDSLITDKKKQLGIIDEYKKSLIFEYVTGKKEVPRPVTIMGINPQAILLAKVIDLFNAHKGKIVNQKLLYLCNIQLGLGLNVQYYRYEHGPYDLRLDSYIDILVSNGWYSVNTDNGQENLVKGKNYAKFLQKYGDQFSQQEASIRELVQYFRGMKRRQIERFATLFAVWNDFIIDGISTPSDEQLIHEVMTNWTPNKANTSYITWQNTLMKMKCDGIMPKGLGLHTLPKPEGGRHNA